MDMAISSAAKELADIAAEQATERAQRVRASQSTSAARWYVAHNGSGHDVRAKETLQRAKFEVYYPAEGVMKLMPRKKLSQKQRRSMIPIYKRVLKPFFPRYFFVRFDFARSDWHEVFALAGLNGIIYTDDATHPLPAPISDGVIARIKAGEVDGAIPAVTMAKKFAYEIGEEVRISVGPFAGFNAIVDNIPDMPIEALDDSARLKLLVALFGRDSVVEMPLADIEKL
jgi:transcriptional antiterminator NusG